MSVMTVETHEGAFLAAYLKFTDEKVDETQEVCDGVNINVDKDGGLIGIEVFDLVGSSEQNLIRGLIDKHQIKERHQVNVLVCTLILYEGREEDDNGNDNL